MGTTIYMCVFLNLFVIKFYTKESQLLGNKTTDYINQNTQARNWPKYPESFQILLYKNSLINNFQILNTKIFQNKT